MASDHDPVPPGILLDLDEALRVLDALQDAHMALEHSGFGLGLQDELLTLVALMHRRLGIGEGGES